MKIFLSLDIEGLPGIISWEWWKNNRKRAADIIIASLTPIIEAIRKVDTDAEITVVDSHSKGENIINLDFIDYNGLYFINGFPRKDYMMAGLTREYDAVMFVGYHTMAGGGGAMDHTYSSSSIYNIRINGKLVGEAAVNAAFAGEYGIPVILVVGQEEMREEMETYLPNTIFVPVQSAVGRFATKSRSIDDIQKIIYEGAINALGKFQRGYINPLVFKPPIEVEIDWLSSAIADVVSQMPIMQRISSRTTRYVVDNWIEGFRWLLSAVYISYLGQR